MHKQKPYKCTNCSLYHFVNDCPSRDSLCYHCNKRGHFKRCCRQLKSDKLVGSTSEVNAIDITNPTISPPHNFNYDTFTHNILSQMVKTFPPNQDNYKKIMSKLSSIEQLIKSETTSNETVNEPNILDTYAKMKAFAHSQENNKKEYESSILERFDDDDDEE